METDTPPQKIAAGKKHRVWLILVAALLLPLSGYLLQSGKFLRHSPNVSIRNPYVIEILGSNKYWSAKYPHASNPLHAAPSVSAGDEIHIPLGTPIVLLLKSTDYVYTFSIPEKGLKEIAVPTLEFRIEFQPTEAAQFDLIGEPICGEPHSQTSGRLIIEPPERFLHWWRTKMATN